MFTSEMKSKEGCILRYLEESIKEYLHANTNLTSREQKLYLYYLKCIFYDVSKFVLFVIFFCIIHKVHYFLFTFCVMFPLRTISGGIHFKHYFSCLIFSLLYIFAVIELSLRIPVPFAICIPTLLLCGVILYGIGQVRSASRPKLTDTERMKLKRKALFVSCAETVLVILIYPTDFAPMVYWSVFLHTLQLIIAKSISDADFGFVLKNRKKL